MAGLAKRDRAVTIGVAGHVDHGKTTLVRVLTGIDTDRSAQEKARGLSIESGVARLVLPDGQEVSLIDVPGHTDFLKNTIRGLHGVDVAILVVAANDGVMPQTREHLEILKFFKAASGMVVLSKTDLVDDETLELAELEVTELLSGTFLESCPLCRFSAMDGTLRAGVLDTIHRLVESLPAKVSPLPFRLWIDQIKSIPGHGTVVSGTVTSGRVTIDDELVLMPSGIRTRARSLKTHGVPVDSAATGQRVGVNLHRVPIEAVSRGMSLVAPDTVQAAYILNATIHTLAGAAQGIGNRQWVRLYLGTSVTRAMAVSMEEEGFDAGKSGLVQLRLTRPVTAFSGDAFVVSPLNRNTVIAGGEVLEVSREKFRSARAGSVLPLLRTLERKDAVAYAEQAFAMEKGRLITAGHLTRKTALPFDAFERYINAKVQKGELVYFKGAGAIRKDHLTGIKKGIQALVEEAFKKDPLKKNVSLAEMAARFPLPVEKALLQLAAEALCGEGELVRADGGYRSREAESFIDTHQEALISLLLEYARNTDLVPFSGDTFWKFHGKRHDKALVTQVLNFLASRDRLIRMNDNRFLSPEAMETIKGRVVRWASEKGFVTVHDCMEMFGYGRWGGTHVLDHLNKIGFTRRSDDKHYPTGYRSKGRPAEGKRHPADFALWKSAKPDEPWWPSPWGRGRPGWHIECSAMSAGLLGEVYDIHGGGSDLIFPHHENEVAQSASLSGKVPATFWLHNGMVTVRGQKMAKSAGNGLDLKDLFERYPPEAIRLWLLSKRYRHPIEFSHTALEGAHASWRRLERFFSAESFKTRIPSPAAHRKSPCWRRFCDAMDDDFNFPKALSIVFEGIRHLNRQTAASPGGPAPVDQETAGHIFRDLYGMCRHVLGFRLDPRGPSPGAAASNLQ